MEAKKDFASMHRMLRRGKREKSTSPLALAFLVFHLLVVLGQKHPCPLDHTPVEVNYLDHLLVNRDAQ
jgi:hypothetical protein